jgi:Rrf2 family protein
MNETKDLDTLAFKSKLYKEAQDELRRIHDKLAELKSAGVVQSKRGVAGGYRLARRPQDITLAVVVRHIEGALAPVSCVSERFYEKCSCPDESRCAIRSVMERFIRFQEERGIRRNSWT